MIDIKSGQEFKEQEEKTDENISKLLNPNNLYERIQQEIIRRVFRK
jgi:hypothetical protein